MRRVTRSATVPYDIERMFSLVSDVESYPDFLPWCDDATVHERTGDVVVASVEMHKGALSKHFTTRNVLRRPEAIEMSLVDGPFKRLSGGWRLRELDDGGCEVSLNLDFEFDSRLMDMMLGPFFENICSSLVNAFTRRAREVYGPV